MNFKVIYCPHHPTIKLIQWSANAESDEGKNLVCMCFGEKEITRSLYCVLERVTWEAPVSFEVLIEGKERLRSPKKLIVSCVEERKICPNSGQFCVGVGVGE